MTPILFANARLIDPDQDEILSGSVLIADGRIAEIFSGDGPASADAARGTQIVECDGAILAPGIIDIGVKVGEPGERHKESYKTAGLAAAAGGVTTIVTRPDTTPPIDTPCS